MTAEGGITVSPAVREFLLAIADDKHLMGQQHAEWIGVTPFLEEDLAFCSIGQDELGHAALIYELLVGDDDPAIDELAFGRPAADWRSCWFVEQATTDWAEALVRHWMFDSADQLRWQLLAESSVPELGQIAARVEREERFHRRHADQLLDVLMAEPDAAARIGTAVAAFASSAQGVFDPVVGEAEAVAGGVATAPFADAQTEWRLRAELRFANAGPIAWGDAPSQQHRTRRSADFAPLLSRMREVFDLDPEAVW